MATLEPQLIHPKKWLIFLGPDGEQALAVMTARQYWVDMACCQEAGGEVHVPLLARTFEHADYNEALRQAVNAIRQWILERTGAAWPEADCIASTDAYQKDERTLVADCAVSQPWALPDGSLPARDQAIKAWSLHSQNSSLPENFNALLISDTAQLPEQVALGHDTDMASEAASIGGLLDLSTVSTVDPGGSDQVANDQHIRFAGNGADVDPTGLLNAVSDHLASTSFESTAHAELLTHKPQIRHRPVQRQPAGRFAGSLDASEIDQQIKQLSLFLGGDYAISERIVHAQSQDISRPARCHSRVAIEPRQNISNFGINNSSVSHDAFADTDELINSCILGVVRSSHPAEVRFPLAQSNTPCGRNLNKPDFGAAKPSISLMRSGVRVLWSPARKTAKSAVGEISASPASNHDGSGRRSRVRRSDSFLTLPANAVESGSEIITNAGPSISPTSRPKLSSRYRVRRVEGTGIGCPLISKSRTRPFHSSVNSPAKVVWINCGLSKPASNKLRDISWDHPLPVVSRICTANSPELIAPARASCRLEYKTSPSSKACAASAPIQASLTAQLKPLKYFSMPPPRPIARCVESHILAQQLRGFSKETNVQTIKDHAPRVNTRLPYFDPANDPQAAGDATTRDLIWLERKRVMSTRNRNARRRTLGLPPTAA